mgnify:CR=1 FL=1
MRKFLFTGMLAVSAVTAFVQTLQSVTDNGSITSNRIAINSGSEGLALVGNSYLSFKDPSNSGRNGYIQHNGSDLVMSADLGTIRLYGRVGVGTAIAYEPSLIHVKATNSSPWANLTEANTNRRIIGMSHTGEEGVIAVSYLDNSGFTPLQFWTSNAPRVTITAGGDIGMGTTDPKGYKLAVNGKVRAHEIKVETANWPDYVFAPGSTLPPLTAPERHIKGKGHLPGIPSAAEVKTNGIDLGAMNAKLLQKIEELTLHLREMEKKHAAQRRLNEIQNKELKMTIQELKSKIK